MTKEKLTFRMSEYWVDKMEKIMEDKKFDSKSDFLRAAVQDFIRREEMETLYEEDTTKKSE